MIHTANMLRSMLPYKASVLLSVSIAEACTTSHRAHATVVQPVVYSIPLLLSCLYTSSPAIIWI